MSPYPALATQGITVPCLTTLDAGRIPGATDDYMSTINYEQAGVMKQLAVVGTVFLPLSFITGFFGMILATCAGLLVFFRRKGWA